MRVGIVILPELRWAQARERWRRAEEYGFDHAWTYDHLGWRDLVDGPWFDAVPTLTAAALATSTMRIGTHVASANFRHPVAFARQITALDDISGGRLLLGLGAGGKGFDTTVLGAEPLSGRQRVDRFAEFVGLLDQLLVHDHTTFRGSYYSAVDARNLPGCVQVPRVPFIVAGAAPRSMAIAARHGDAWVTTGTAADDAETWWREVEASSQRFSEALEAAGRSPESFDRHLSPDPTSPVASLSSVAAFAETLERAAALGFTDLICHWPRASGWYAGDESVLDDVASEIRRRRLGS